MTDPALELNQVTFTYRNTGCTALSEVSLQVLPGQWIGVMGCSGAGKSTLCLALNGLVPNFLKGELRGTIQAGGVDVQALPVPTRARDVGLVFQDFEAQLFSTRSDLEVAFFPENLGVPAGELPDRVARCLSAVHLHQIERREPATLSGGEKQRLVVASVMAGRPRVLALDEPLSDLDPPGREDVLAVLADIAATGTAVVLVENDPVALTRTDRVVLLSGGRIVREGPTGELLRDNDALRGAGLPPDPLCDLFERLGLSERPLSVEEALASWPPDLRLGAEPPDPPPAAPVLEARGVSFKYETGAVPAVANVTVGIPRGRITALVGCNGSGKSTLALMLAGLLAPSKGEVVRPAVSVGFIFQNPDHQIFAETVRDEVAFAPLQQGLATADVEDRVRQALETVGLQGRESDDPFSMTRGERQRVAVASVLAARPGILIFDEPTTGLDHTQVEAMMSMIRRLCQDGRTVLMITHAIDIVARYADHVAVMEGGGLVVQGPTRQVLFAGMDVAQSPVLQLSRALGKRLLTADEFVAAVRLGSEAASPSEPHDKLNLQHSPLYTIRKHGPIQYPDPRTRILALLLGFVIPTAFQSPPWSGAVLLMALLSLLWTGPDGLKRLKTAAPLLGIIMLSCFVLWPLAVRGPTEWYGPWTVEGVAFGVGMGFRLASYTLLGLAYVVTSPVEESAWGLQKLGLPYRMAFGLVMAFRLLEVTFHTAATVQTAQSARGIRTDARGLVARIRQTVPLLVPVLVLSLRRVDVMAMAMEARAFGIPGRRTSLLSFHMGPWDWFLLAWCGILAAASIWLRVHGVGVLIPDRL